MHQIEITIRGPGCTFFSELNIIKNIFKLLGYNVKIDDEYNHQNDGKVNRSHNTNTEIVIKTIHDPWGG